jgi:DNA-binding GntR family transcriptional regulator
LVQATTPPDSLAPSEVYALLRRQILDGTRAPGSALPQGLLAEELGVSRTPLREAMRRLHGEGLVDLERYRRPRVAGFDPDDLESIYASRIALETLGIAVTVPRLTQRDIDELRGDLERMQDVEGDDAIDAWEQLHREFHERLIGNAPHLVPQFRSLADRSYRYRQLLYIDHAPVQRWLVGRRDHKEIVDACEELNAAKAMHALAEHLARTALVMMSQIAPDREPEMVRTALRIATSADPTPRR